MMFCSIVGQAMRQTTGPMGPSTIERSNFWGLGATSGTGLPVYYADFRLIYYTGTVAAPAFCRTSSADTRSLVGRALREDDA
jgi:hypothetical protein